MINPGNYVKLLVMGFFDAERKAAENQKMFTAAAANKIQSPKSLQKADGH